MHNIDFVVMWVDGNDPKWQAKRDKFAPAISHGRHDNSEVRYRDWDNLELWIQSVYAFAPWVNRIFLITDDQVPSFLAKYDKVVRVDHKDFIPESYLPTFSANPIELNIHRIENLSEQFVLFNDDMFLIKPVKPTDFFLDNKPRDVYGLNVVAGFGVKEIIQNITLNDVSIINSHFGKNKQIKGYFKKWFSFKNGSLLIRTILLMPWGFFAGFVEPHVANSYLKSTFKTLWEVETDVLHQTSSHRFRNIGDVNQWLMRYWQLASGLSMNRSNKFGKLFDITDENVDECVNWILNQKSSVVCINDKPNISDFEATKGRINEALNRVINS